MPEHATGSRAAKGNLVSRIDAQLPKRLTPEADLYVDAADGGPHATPDRAAWIRKDGWVHVAYRFPDMKPVWRWYRQWVVRP